MLSFKKQLILIPVDELFVFYIKLKDVYMNNHKKGVNPTIIYFISMEIKPNYKYLPFLKNYRPIKNKSNN